jgi:hypothetical protein
MNIAMKKLIIIIACVGIVLACSKEEEITPVPTQMLKNTDMEKTSESWTSFASEEGFIHNWTTEASYSPSRSLTLSRTTSSPEGYSWFNQRITQDIPHGKDVTLKVMIKGVNLKGNGISIIISCSDNRDQIIHAASTETGKMIKGSFDWTSHTITLKNLDKNTAFIDVGMIYLTHTTGIVYFDDATLEYIK